MQINLSENALELFAKKHLRGLGYTVEKRNETGPTHLYVARKTNNDGKWFYQMTQNPTKRTDWWVEEAEIEVKDLKFYSVKENNAKY